MKLFKKLVPLSIVSIFALSFVALPFAAAQSANERGGSGLQLSPTRTELSGQPGEAKTFSVTLKNVTQGDLDVQVFLNDFESDNESGTPKIIVDETREQTPYSLKKMITGLQPVNLKANETKQISSVVNIPGDAAPGAYYGAMRFSAVPTGQTSGDRQVSLTASVAHLIFVEVPGDVTEQIKLEKLVALDEKGKERNIFKKPGKSALTVKNLGNGFSRPFGKVTVNKGSSQVHTYDVNNAETKSIVLPQSTRVFTDDIKNVSKPGKYKLVAGIAYGNGGEVVTYESTFWYLPLWFVAVLVVLLIALVVGGWILYKKMARGGTKKSKKA